MKFILSLILLCIFPFIGCGGDNQGSNDVGYVEQSRVPVKSLAEIASDLSKVTTTDSWDAVEGEQDSLKKMALDLEESFSKSMGEFASRAAFLQKNLIILFKRDMDMKNREIIINKTLEDAKQLNHEIDEVILVTPEDKLYNLKSLNELNESVKETLDQAKEINKHKNGFTINREEIIVNIKCLSKNIKEISQENKKLAQYNKKLEQYNKELSKISTELAKNNENMRYKLNLARATKLLNELIKNINQGTLMYPDDSASGI